MKTDSYNGNCWETLTLNIATCSDCNEKMLMFLDRRKQQYWPKDMEVL